jgi:hypothetical protein
MNKNNNSNATTQDKTNKRKTNNNNFVVTVIKYAFLQISHLTLYLCDPSPEYALICCPHAPKSHELMEKQTRKEPAEDRENGVKPASCLQSP